MKSPTSDAPRAKYASGEKMRSILVDQVYEERGL